jgi:hypothetical protein
VLQAEVPLLLVNSGQLRVLAEAEPGLSVMATLELFDPSLLAEDDRLWFLQAWGRQQAWVASRLVPAFVAVAGAEPVDQDDFVREDVRVALRLSGATAQRRIDVARILARVLPATLAALEVGTITQAHADVIAEAVVDRDPVVAQRVEELVLERAGSRTVAEFRRAVAKAVALADPVGCEVAHVAATEGRKVAHYVEPDGMATIAALLPAAGAQTVFTALDTLARAHPDPALGIDARRADALVRLCAHYLADPDLPLRHGRPVGVQIVVDLPTLLGLADHPGELVGYGPIPPSVARSLAADGVWRRLVAEPVTGHLLDYGRTLYRPPQELVDYLLARDRVCRFPGCNQPAYLCEIDHSVPFDSGGTTSACSCGAVCKRHHQGKTLHGWQLESHPDGSCTWTSPTGRITHVPANNHLPTAI